MEYKYNFYEIVKVIPTIDTDENIVGMEGAVLGWAQNDNGEMIYAISINGITYSLPENQLCYTGKFGKREDYY